MHFTIRCERDSWKTHFITNQFGIAAESVASPRASSRRSSMSSTYSIYSIAISSVCIPHVYIGKLEASILTVGTLYPKQISSQEQFKQHTSCCIRYSVCGLAPAAIEISEDDTSRVVTREYVVSIQPHTASLM